MEPQGDIVKVFKDEQAYTDFDLKFRRLKLEMFGTEEFILHTGEITRPTKSKSKNEHNHKFSDANFRLRFYTEMNILIEQSEFTIITRAIDKIRFNNKYPNSTPDPYLFCFDYILNRIIFDTQSQQTVEVYPEKRCPSENTRLVKQLKKAKRSGTRLLPARKIRKRLKKFELTNKTSNISGLQLADLIVSPIGRHLINKPEKPNNEISFNLIKTKLRNRLEIFPKL